RFRPRHCRLVVVKIRIAAGVFVKHDEPVISLEPDRTIAGVTRKHDHVAAVSDEPLRLITHLFGPIFIMPCEYEALVLREQVRNGVQVHARAVLDIDAFGLEPADKRSLSLIAPGCATWSIERHLERTTFLVSTGKAVEAVKAFVSSVVVGSRSQEGHMEDDLGFCAALLLLWTNYKREYVNASVRQSIEAGGPCWRNLERRRRRPAKSLPRIDRRSWLRANIRGDGLGYCVRRYANALNQQSARSGRVVAEMKIDCSAWFNRSY